MRQLTRKLVQRANFQVQREDKRDAPPFRKGDDSNHGRQEAPRFPALQTYLEIGIIANLAKKHISTKIFFMAGADQGREHHFCLITTHPKGRGGPLGSPFFSCLLSILCQGTPSILSDVLSCSWYPDFSPHGANAYHPGRFSWHKLQGPSPDTPADSFANPE